MTECNLCGECCMVIPLWEKNMPGETKEWLRARGAREEQGFFLLDCPCKKLAVRKNDKGETEHYCTIHNTKPAICRRWKGQSRIKERRYYVPPGCAYRKNLQSPDTKGV